jgi:hypothetical protein
VSGIDKMKSIISLNEKSAVFDQNRNKYKLSYYRWKTSIKSIIELRDFYPIDITDLMRCFRAYVRFALVSCHQLRITFADKIEL